MAAGYLRQRPTGVDLFVRLTPKSSRDSVDGPAEASDGSVHVRARVRAAPEDGLANRALARLFADWIGVPRGTVTIPGGATSRLKTLHIAGDPARIAALVETRMRVEGR